MQTITQKKPLFLAIIIILCNYISISFSQKSENFSYYPLELGNKWDYSNDYFPHTEKIVDTTRISGLLYYGLAMWSSEQAEYWLRTDNNRIYLLNMKDSLNFILYNFNAAVGESWELPSDYECSFGTQITLTSKEDTIMTPAGTFINCYHFKHKPACYDAGIYDTWFAKGVGKIRYISDNYAGMMEYNLSDYTIITSLNNHEQPLTMKSYQLYQNYPNPFNSITIIPYSLLKSNYVTIKLYNLLGQEILSLVNDFKNAGFHFVTFDACQIPSGTYFYQLEIENQNISTKKLLYLK